MKILLIEDDKNLCNMIKQQLTKENYIVDACTSGEDGMIYALNPDNGYALAIIDRMLPVIDGLTIIKAMRKKLISIPVIIITGMSELNDKIDGLDNGADDYLVKPFPHTGIVCPHPGFDTQTDSHIGKEQPTIP